MEAVAIVELINNNARVVVIGQMLAPLNAEAKALALPEHLVIAGAAEQEVAVPGKMIAIAVAHGADGIVQVKFQMPASHAEAVAEDITIAMETAMVIIPTAEAKDGNQQEPDAEIAEHTKDTATDATGKILTGALVKAHATPDR